MSLSAEDIIKLRKFLNHPQIQKHIKISEEFRNYTDSQINPDALVIDIEDEETLKQVLRVIHALNNSKPQNDPITVRAVAGGRTENNAYSASYSATEITKADINLRLVGPDFIKIKRLADSNVVRVGGSVQIMELQKLIERKYGLVLPTASLIPYVTVAGLSATGGHGTGRDMPSFAGLIRGATIITAHGEEVRLERGDPDFDVLMSAHCGMLGVIKDMDIDCMPARKLQNIEEKRSLADLFDEIRNGLFLKNEYVSVLISPLYRKDELTNRDLKNVGIITQKPVPRSTLNINHHPSREHLKQEAEMRAEQLVNVPEFLRQHEELVPAYMQNLVSPASIGEKDEFSEGDWATQWHFRTAFPHPDCGNNSAEKSVLDEICAFIPVADTGRGEAHGEEIIKFLNDLYAKLHEEMERGEYAVSYAIFIRFLKGTKNGLSCTAVPDGYHSCAIDITTIGGAGGFDELKRFVTDITLNEYNGKFHPGKNWSAETDFRRIYGDKLDQYKNALQRWNQKHHIDATRNPFLNDLMRAALEYPPRQLQIKPAMEEVPVNLSALKQAGMYKPVDTRQQKEEREHRANKKSSCCVML